MSGQEVQVHVISVKAHIYRPIFGGSALESVLKSPESTSGAADYGTNFVVVSQHV